MDYYKKYQSQEWVDIQNELEEDEKSASIMDEFKDNNNLKIKTMEAINKLIKELKKIAKAIHTIKQ